MNDGADAVAVVIWNIVQRHELCVAGEDLVPVDLGGDALAADFFNVRYAAAVDLFAVGFLQTFADGVRGGALGERGVLEQLCFVHRAVVDGSDLKHALRERAGFIEHDDFCIGEGLKIVGALDEHALMACAADARKEAERDGNDKCARAADDKEGQRAVDPIDPSGIHAEHHAQERHGDAEQYSGNADRRGVNFSEAGDERFRTGLAGTGVFNEVEDFGNGGLAEFLCGADFQNTV